MSRVLHGLIIGLALAAPASAQAADPAQPTCSYGTWGQWTNSAASPLVLHATINVPVMCADGTGQPLLFEVVEQGALGRLAFDNGGFARYTPRAPLPLTGQADAVRFRAVPVGHPELASTVYTVHVKVGRDQNHAPVCTVFDPPTSGVGLPDDALALAFCQDSDIDPVSFTTPRGAGPQQGELVFSEFGVGYRRYAGTSAADTFTVVATDPYGASDTVTLTVAAGPAPEGAPTAPPAPAQEAVDTAEQLTSLLTAPRASRTALRRVLRTGKVPGPTILPDANGRATVTATAAGRTLGTRRATLREGRRVALDVPLNRAGRRALRRAKKPVRVAFRVVVRDVAGATRRTAYRVRLRR